MPELVAEALHHLEARRAVLQEVAEALGDPIAVLAVHQRGPGRQRVWQLILAVAELLLPARREPHPVLGWPPVPDAVVAAQDGEAQELLPLAQPRLDRQLVQIDRRQKQAGQHQAGDEALQADQFAEDIVGAEQPGAAELGGQQRRGGDAEDHGNRHPARRPQRDAGDNRKDDEGGGAAFRRVGPDHRQLQRREGEQREQARLDPAFGRDALFAAVGQDEEAGRDGQDAAGVAAPEQQHVVPIVGPAGDADRVHHIERGERVEQRADRRADGDQRRDVAQPPQRAVEIRPSAAAGCRSMPRISSGPAAARP